MRVPPNMLTDESLVTRQLDVLNLVIVALPNYLQKRFTPSEPEDLAKLKFVAVTSTLRRPTLELVANHDRRVLIDMRCRMSTDSPIFSKEMVIRGCGLGLLPEFLVSEGIRKGKLIRLLPEFDLLDEKLDVKLAFSNRKLLPGKVRCFIDYALSHYRGGALPAPAHAEQTPMFRRFQAALADSRAALRPIVAARTRPTMR